MTSRPRRNPPECLRRRRRTQRLAGRVRARLGQQPDEITMSDDLIARIAAVMSGGTAARPTPPTGVSCPASGRRPLLRALTLALAALTLCALTGCSTSHGTNSSTSSPTTTSAAQHGAPPATASAPSTAAAHPATIRIAHGATASQIAALIGCTPDPATSDSVNVNLGPTPASAVDCRGSYGPVEIDVWKSSTDQTAALAAVKSFAAGAGTLWYVQGPIWDLTANITTTGNQTVLSAAQQAQEQTTAQRLHALVGGTLVKVGG